MKTFKTLISIFVFILSLGSAELFAAQVPSKYDQKMLQILSVHELGVMNWRKDMLELYDRMDSVLDSEDGKIHARDLETLHKHVLFYLNKIKNPSESLIKDLPNMINENDLIYITTEKESFIDKDGSRYAPMSVVMRNRSGKRSSRSLRNSRLRQVKNTVYYINPSDKLGKSLLKQLKIQFAVRLTLLDHFFYGFGPFVQNSKLRRSIAKQLPDSYETEKMTFKEIWSHYMRDIYKTDVLVKGYKAFVEGAENKSLVASINRTDFEKSIDHIIRNSWSFSKLKKKDEEITFFEDIKENIKYMTRRRRDVYDSAANVTVNALSMAFGNTAGLFQSRHGKLYYMSKAEEESLHEEMQPLDVVFEKTPFRLTDKFIPGHWGHAAVWTGNEDQLKELGVWDELPKLYKHAVEKRGYNGPSFQQAVRDGHRIIEALRPGVQFNTLRHFLEIDDLAVVRMKDCPKEMPPQMTSKGDPVCLTNSMKKEYLLKAFQQVGKDYDFNFDVNTIDKIVCSELLYRTFIDVKFDTTLTIGRHSISPDQVAYKVVGEEPVFDPVYIYFNGTRINKDSNALRKVINDLMKGDYDKVQEFTGICADYSGKTCE